MRKVVELDHLRRFLFPGNRVTHFHIISFLDACDIYTWGASVKGTLGHGEQTEELIPRVIESLLGRDIRYVACGTDHTLALSGDHCFSI